MQDNSPDYSAYERFGKFLMENVRDRAIVEWDLTASGHMHATKLTREAIASANEQCLKIIHILIPDIVDSTLFFLLRALDDDRDIAITIRNDSGVETNLVEVTETIPWELSNWIQMFSQQRAYP